MLNGALKLDSNVTKLNNIVVLPTVTKPERRTTSNLKSNGIPKAQAADPIRDVTEIKRIQSYFLRKKQLRNYCLFTIGVSFGIRAGDLIKLTVGDIRGEYLNIFEQKTRKRNKPKITPAVRNALDVYLETRGKVSDDEYLFPSRQLKDGKQQHITIQQLNNIIKKAAKDCCVSGHISSHSLRKTFAYQLLCLNEYDEEARFTLQSMLNHNDIRTTMAYSGLTQDKQDTMRMQLDALLK